MPIYFLLFFLYGLVGCSGLKGSDTNKQSMNDSVILRDFIRLDTTVLIDRVSTPYNGDIYFKSAWKDARGNNKFIISKTSNDIDGNGRAEIYAYHYLNHSSAWKLYWSEFDYVNGNGCDLKIDIPYEYIKITDLDGNNEAETAYLYTLDNRCDAVVVPTRMKIHVGKEMTTIRGFSQLSLGPSEDRMNNYLREQGEPEVSYKKTSENWERLTRNMQKNYSHWWDEYVNK